MWVSAGQRAGSSAGGDGDGAEGEPGDWRITALSPADPVPPQSSASLQSASHSTSHSADAPAQVAAAAPDNRPAVVEASQSEPQDLTTSEGRGEGERAAGHEDDRAEGQSEESSVDVCLSDGGEDGTSFKRTLKALLL